MDDLGRFIIPGDIREAFGWGPGTKLDVEITDVAARSIIIREIAPCCSLCRKEFESLEKIEKGYVCPQCVASIK